MATPVYKYNKVTDNGLHKAAFRGKIEKVKSLLQYVSPYKTTSDGQTPFHLSLSKGHEQVANIFLNIFETDLATARAFLQERKINTSTSDQNFILALGENQIARVQAECNEMVLNETEGDPKTYDKLTIVLLKENVYSAPKVLGLHPKNEIQKFKLLSIVFDLIKENGVVSLNTARSDDRCTPLHLASSQGYTSMVLKLLALGGDPFAQDIAHQTAMGSAHSMGEFPTYIAMCHQLNLNMFESKTFVRLSISNAVWEKVEFFVEKLVTMRMEQFVESRETAIRSVLAMNEIAQTFLLSNIGEKCLQKYGDYLQDKKLSKIIQLLVNDTNRNSELVMKYIRKDYTVVREKTTRVIQYKGHNRVLHSLVRNGWNTEIREIYQEFPRLKNILFEHKEIGLNALIQCIQSNHIDLAEFLITEHEAEIDCREHWSQLLIAASEANGSLDFMKMILNHRMTDPNLVLSGHQYVYTNALFACISKGNLERLGIILESEKLTNLNVIKGKFDTTLLQSSIFSMRTADPPSDIYDYQRCPPHNCVYLTNDLDTSEDEAVDTQQQRNPSAANQDVATRYEIMNNIFDKLIEKGANYRHISGSYQTLLHHAVQRSNKYVVQKLLEFGLDPIDPDCYGNLPIHYVNNIEIFNILKDHRTFPQTVLMKNKSGETVLHIYVRCKMVSVDLCTAFIDHGVDVDSLDYQDQTPLHNVQSVAACEVLIDSNADLNLKNKSGQTPAHVALAMGNFEIAAILLKQPSLDLFVLTNDGKSFLSIFSTITDSYFEKIKTSLDGRQEELQRLIELYCNETDGDGVSNLYHATNNKYLIPSLLAQENLQVCGSKYNDLLLHSVGSDEKLAKFFVDNGLDVNKVDVHLRTPLIEAITANQNIEIVKYLITAGADVKFVGWRGTTPLHVACTYLNINSIPLLLQAGANFIAQDADGKVPFQCLPIEYRSIIQKIIF